MRITLSRNFYDLEMMVMSSLTLMPTQRRIQGPYYPALARASDRPERLIILFIKGKITMISL
jgi:hypothetical protein